jgi:hypothetical protein
MSYFMHRPFTASPTNSGVNSHAISARSCIGQGPESFFYSSACVAATRSRVAANRTSGKFFCA